MDVIVSDMTLFNYHKIAVDVSIHHRGHVENYFEFTIGKVDRRIAVSAGFHHAKISQMGFELNLIPKSEHELLILLRTFNILQNIFFIVLIFANKKHPNFYIISTYKIIKKLIINKFYFNKGRYKGPGRAD